MCTGAVLSNSILVISPRVCLGRHSYRDTAMVYVSTNEQNATVLAEIRQKGYKLFEDLNLTPEDIPKSGNVEDDYYDDCLDCNRSGENMTDYLPLHGRALTQLDKMMVELSLMAMADVFMHTGITNVAHLVNRVKHSYPVYSSA